MRKDLDLIETIKETERTQRGAAELWQRNLNSGVYNAHGPNGTLPREIEWTLRNPAAYLDRLESGAITLPTVRQEKWTILARQASAIVTASYVIQGVEEPKTTLNPLSEMQQLAFTGGLSSTTRSLLAEHMIQAAYTFGDSIHNSHTIPELSYLRGNARAAFKNAPAE